MSTNDDGSGYYALFFREVISSHADPKHNPRFQRRDWLADEVGKLLKKPNARFILLTAEPGFGKSVFMAQLAHDHPEWPRYFIRRDQRELLAGVGSRSFLLRIGYQLSALYPKLFERDALQIAVEQRIDDVQNRGEVIGAEVDKIIGSPFHRDVLTISQQIDRVSGEVIGLRIRELVTDPHRIEMDDLQNMALIDPARALQKLHPDRQIVILVDALDEVRYHETKDNLLRWLANSPELPGNIRFLLTARPPDGNVQYFVDKQQSRTQRLTLEGEIDEAFRRYVEKDVQTYVDGLLAEPHVQRPLQNVPDGADHFRKQVIKKAEGNLGYLDALARGIDQAREQNDDQTIRELLTLENLPDDMQGLYAFFLHQIRRKVGEANVLVTMPDSGAKVPVPMWSAVYYPMLEVLAVALEPVTLEQIQHLGNILAGWSDLNLARENLLQFLDREENRYRLYHATLPEFLTDSKTKQANGTEDLYIDAIQVHRRISDYYWRTYRDRWSDCDAYGLNNLTAHLLQAQQKERLIELIDHSYRQARIEQTGSPVAFAQDVELALSVARKERPRDIEQWVRLCAVFARGISAAPPLIIDVLARAGQQVRARWMAANIGFGVDRCLAHALIAGQYAQSGEMAEARRLLDEAERTLPAINEAHRTMAYFWLVRTALALGDRDLAQAFLAAAEKIAFSGDSPVIDEWDLPNVLFWLAKSARLLEDEELLGRIREVVHERDMNPLRNMVLQTMSVAGDVEGLRVVARQRLQEPYSSVRLANLALALADAGLREPCQEILALIDEGAPDHGGDDNAKRHVWARALLGRFDHALRKSVAIDDAEQKMIALSRIVEVAHRSGAAAVVDQAVEVARSVEGVMGTNSILGWPVLTRLAALLQNAGYTAEALAAAEMVARADVPTTLANTLTFSGRKQGDDIVTVPLETSINFSETRNDGSVFPLITGMSVKTGKRPVQTYDRDILDQENAKKVLKLAENDDRLAAEQLLATIRTPAIRAQTLAEMTAYASDPAQKLDLRLDALDAARLAGWREFESAVDSWLEQGIDQVVRNEVEAVVSEVAQW